MTTDLDLASERLATAGSPAIATQEQPPDMWRKLMTVAWMSILLGIAIEILLLLGLLATAGSFKAAAIVADLVQKVSWSFLVCVGIAFGTAAAKSRPAVMGVLGLISAPVAFTTAKSTHKAVGQALGLAGATGGASPLLIAALKAVEYAVLGFVLGKMSRQGRGLGAYLGMGAAAGLTFGIVIVTVITRAAPAPATFAAVLPRAINEVVFPVGCSLVLYAAEALGKRPAAA